MAVDALAKALGVSFDREKYDALIAETRIGTEKVLLMKPQTFMNLSGRAVAQAARNGMRDADDLMVVVDEVQLPLGRIRIRKGGSAGGHNGLKSIIEHVGTQAFPRLRLGVGGPADSDEMTGHVLGSFRPEEWAAAEAMAARAAEALQTYLTDGLDAAMNRFNRDAP